MTLLSWLARFIERHVCAPAPEPRILPPLPRYAECCSPHQLRGHTVEYVDATDEDAAWAVVAGGTV